MSLFCDHDWQPRTGMDCGSICCKCSTVSDREVKTPSTGLTDGKLQSNIEHIREKYNKLDNNNSMDDVIKNIFS